MLNEENINNQNTETNSEEKAEGVKTNNETSETKKETKKFKFDLTTILHLVNYGLLFISILFTFSWLMAYSNSLSIGAAVGMTAFTGVISMFWFFGEVFNLVLFFLNKGEKKLTTLITAIVYVFISFFVMVTNYQYLAVFNGINSAFSGFPFN